MFVKRKQSSRKGPTDKQIYVPYECRLKDKGYPSIRNQSMAEFYFNELKQIGYIQPPQPTPPGPTPGSPHNAMLVTLSSSDEGYLEFDPNTNALGPNDIDPDSFDPPYDSSRTYEVYFNQAVFMNMTTSDGESHTYLAGQLKRNANLVDFNGYGQQQAATMNVPLTYIQGMTSHIIGGTRYIFFWGPPNPGSDPNAYDRFFAFKANEWVIDLSPVQTLINLWLREVTPDLEEEEEEDKQE